MTIAKHLNIATLLEGAGHDLAPSGGQVTLDEAWAPYAQASVTVPLGDETLTELLDPREDRRIEIELEAQYPTGERPTSTRTVNLGLRERTIDHETGEVTLELASDEALLMDDVWRESSTNTDALAYQSSLRAIIDNVVLSRIGASLEPGDTDTTFYVLSDAENILNDSGYRAGAVGASIPGWMFNNPGAPSTGNVAKVAITNAPEAGLLYAAKVSGLTAASGNVGIWNQGGENATPAYVTVTAGAPLNGRIWVRTNAAVTVRLNYQFINSSGGVVGSIQGTSTAIPANTWTLVTSSATVPAGSARLGVFCYTVGASPAGLNFEVAGAVVTDNGVVPAGFFDGTTTDTTDYGYVWSGTANASRSERIALIDRSPELLNWEPGESAWNFIQPLFQAAGLRLFCDELRRWFLVNGSEYIADGQTQLAVPVNLTRAEDTISRDSDEWFDAAVVTYNWRDSEGTAKTHVETYAESGATRTRTFTIERPYPGDGFARYVVRRAQGKGRTLDVAAMSQYSVTPSQPVTVSLPSSPIQTGVVRAVSWGLSDGLMRVETRGLTDTPPTAWVFLNADEAWTDSTAGESWLDETIGA